MSDGWERVKNQWGLWKEENLIEFSREWQMEAGSRIRAHTDTPAQRGYKHKQNRRYLGFSTKCDEFTGWLGATRRGRTQQIPVPQETLPARNDRLGVRSWKLPGAGDSFAARLLYPSFVCGPHNPGCLLTSQSSFIPAFSVGCLPFRISGLDHSPLLSRLNFESRCWMRPFGITCSHDASCCLSCAAVNTVTTHFTLRICCLALVIRNRIPSAGL